MARMVPERPADTASAAEVVVFNKIRDELSGEWTALHSVGLTIHNTKPWAEIDFVLIGPPGVFCLEVKGGIVSREGGVWYTTPQYGPKAGRRQRLKESPFEQVGSASAQLFSFLDALLATVGRSITGYAVATPDVAWTVRGPDIDLALIYDQDDVRRSFDEFMKRAAKRWTEKVGSKRKTLGRADKQLILDSIRGDFRLVPSLRATADIAQGELLRLTEEQSSLFGRLASNERVITKGGAGTGKTVIAVEEARRLAREGRRVLYTCFNKNLATHVESLLSTEPRVRVRTLHGLMMGLVTASDRQSELPDVSNEDLWGLFLPELALDVLLDDKQGSPFDVVVVDEGQDLLRESYLDVIEGLVGGNLSTGQWRIFHDPNQNVFGGMAASALRRVSEAKPVEWPLTVNCRNTAPIAQQVSLLSGVPLSDVLAPNGPDVEICWYDSADEQSKAIKDALHKLKREGFRPSQSVVLSRYRLERSAISGAGLSIADLSRGGDGDETDGVRFSTIASFKGLEADVVILADVDDLFSNEGLASVYVGASRAKVALFVYVATSQKQRFQALAKEFGRALVERS
jgi:hypothetical protein